MQDTEDEKKESVVEEWVGAEERRVMPRRLYINTELVRHAMIEQGNLPHE